MRVAILYDGYISRKSGTSERVYQIAKNLADLGVQVTLSAAKENSLNTTNHRNLCIIYMPNSILKVFSVIKWIVQLITCTLTNRYEIVQIESFSFFKTILLYVMFRPFCKKCIVVFHDKCFEDDPRKSIISKLQLILQKIVLLIFDAAITPGMSVKKFFEELHGDLLLRKMIVIPNGTPEAEYRNCIDRSSLRKYYGINEEDFVALYFGSMTFKPNYEAALLLYKMSNYVSSKFEKNNGKRLVFIVAGVGSEYLPKSMCFIPLGFVKNLDELLSLPDVIVLPHMPSHSGPHVKTMYAFRSKKPVVASKDAVKDMPDIVPGKHFLLFDIEKPDTLVEALSDIYRNAELRKNITLNAYMYSKKFSWKYISSLHLKLYNKILKNV